MSIFRKKVPDQTLITNFPDGGIRVIPGRDQPNRNLRGQIFHRWVERGADGREHVYYSSVPGYDGTHYELRPAEGGTQITLKDEKGNIISDQIDRGPERR